MQKQPPIDDAIARDEKHELQERLDQQTAELLRQKDFLRTVIDSVADPIFVKDRDHRWIEGNKAFWELVGPEQNIKGKSDYDLFPKEQADHFWAGDERVFAGEKFDEEENLMRPDGNLRIVATKKVPVRFHDGTLVLVGVIRDVTEQRAIKEELRRHQENLEHIVESQTKDLVAAKERAESASNAKTEFLANMSHEIRTPMNAVIGIASILSSMEPLTPKQREMISVLQGSAESLLKLLNDLLDIAKIESKSVVLEEVEFSLESVLHKTIDMLAVQARQKGLNLSLNTQAITGRSYIGDPTRLRQALLNLCSNAIKFTERGIVRIRATSTPGDKPGTENIEISINDTGIGISPEKIGTIFDKFVQGDASISRRYGGTGLGLAITKTLIETMGGSIDVTSEVSVGTTFIMRMPLASVATSEEKTPSFTLDFGTPSYGGLGAKNRVLVVEDYAPNILVTTSFLQSWGYPYEVAENGSTAIQKMRDEDFAVVLMDVQMPGINGLEATSAIRKHEKETGRAHLPIIGMTAHAMTGDQERCLAAGMDDYLSKPFNPEDLRQKLALYTSDKQKAA